MDNRGQLQPPRAGATPSAGVVGTTAARRGWVTALAWLVAVPFLLLAMIRTGGYEQGWPAVQLIAYTPYALLLSMLALLAVVLVRRWVAAFFLLLAVLAFTLAVLPREFGAVEPADRSRSLRVLALNLQNGEADPDEVLGLARSREVDLLVLTELTPEYTGKLDALGVGSLYPEQALRPEAGVLGAGIWSRWKLQDAGNLDTRPRQPRVAVRVPTGIPVELVAVHPTAPTGPRSTGEWGRDFDRMPAAGSSGLPLILAGDFNATLDHVRLRDLIETGYRDAGDVAGRGLVTTWPSRPKWPPPITIDHVLAERGIGITDYDVEKVDGTDHRAVFAELTLPSLP